MRSKLRKRMAGQPIWRRNWTRCSLARIRARTRMLLPFLQLSYALRLKFELNGVNSRLSRTGCRKVICRGDAHDDVLKTKFYANIGLPLLGMVADRSGKAAQKRVAEDSARCGCARGRPTQFRA